jgi:hypothetical protein
MPMMPTMSRDHGPCSLLLSTLYHHSTPSCNTQVHHQQRHTRHHHQHSPLGPPPTLRHPKQQAEARSRGNAPSRSPTSHQESDSTTISDRMGTHATRLPLQRMDQRIPSTLMQQRKKRYTIRWSTTIINCLWTYAFNMWDHRCKILAEDKKGLKFTKIDNAIRSLYDEKDLFMSIDKGLFATPLVRVLAKTTSMKEAHLLGLQAAKMRWESNTAPDEALENLINPTRRQAIEARRKKRRKVNKSKQRKEDKRREAEDRQRQRQQHHHTNNAPT